MAITKSQKKKWVEALRSGEYEQYTGELKHKYASGGTAFCCLGVLQDLIGCRKKSNGDELLPKRVLPLDIQDRLASMNDNGRSFAQIATAIERAKDI